MKYWCIQQYFAALLTCETCQITKADRDALKSLEKFSPRHTTKYCCVTILTCIITWPEVVDVYCCLVHNIVGSAIRYNREIVLEN